MDDTRTTQHIVEYYCCIYSRDINDANKAHMGTTAECIYESLSTQNNNNGTSSIRVWYDVWMRRANSQENDWVSLDERRRRMTNHEAEEKNVKNNREREEHKKRLCAQLKNNNFIYTRTYDVHIMTMWILFFYQPKLMVNINILCKLYFMDGRKYYHYYDFINGWIFTAQFFASSRHSFFYSMADGFGTETCSWLFVHRSWGEGLYVYLSTFFSSLMMLHHFTASLTLQLRAIRWSHAQWKIKRRRTFISVA